MNRFYCTYKKLLYLCKNEASVETENQASENSPTEDYFANYLTLENMSFARTATLRISDQSYDLMYFSYGFNRDTDYKGRPCANMEGGLISLTMESTKSTALLERLVNTDRRYPTSHPPRAISGSVEVCDAEDGMVIRRLVFEEAFIVHSEEEMHSNSWLPMMETITISPLRLDINRTIRLDRRWPQAPHGWQRYVQEERMVATYEKTEAQLQILRIYWIDEQDEQRELSELFVGQSVTMCVEVEAAGAGKTIDLTIEAPTGTTIKGGGTYLDIRVDGKSTAYIDNFQLEPQS